MNSSRKSYDYYVLAMLTGVYTLNCADGGLIILLLQPIKTDLHLSDTQLGFLTGIAFGIFYSTLGLPIARWADRGSRVAITSIAIGMWGATVMSSVFVSNFLQMSLVRIAAAVGESGCMPPTYSLLGDYFREPVERTRAMTIYMLSGPLGSLISFMLGGWLNERYGWRETYLLMGIPGVILAVLVGATVRDPRVTGGDARFVQARHIRMIDVLGRLWRQRSSRNLCIGIVLLYTLGNGLGPWYAAFMMRSHGMGSEQLGIWLGLMFGIGGFLGVLAGGYVATKWFAANEARQMRFTALTVGALFPCLLIFLLVPDRRYAIISLLPLLVAFSVFLGPTFALLQRLVSDEMRATALAIVMLLANLIGMGVGPQIVGVLSDLLSPALGSDSLRYAMLAMSLVALVASYHFWQIGGTVARDLVSAGH